HRRAAHERRIVGREGEARAARDLLAVDAPLDLEVGRVARRRQRELLRLLEAQTLDAVRRHADLELRLDRRDLPARADLGLTVARGERDLAVAGDRHRELRSVARGLAVDRPGVGDAVAVRIVDVGAQLHRVAELRLDLAARARRGRELRFAIDVRDLDLPRLARRLGALADHDLERPRRVARRVVARSVLEAIDVARDDLVVEPPGDLRLRVGR